MIANAEGEVQALRPFRTGLVYMPGMVLLLMMLVVPAAYQPIKSSLVAIVVGQVLVTVLWTGRLRLHPTISFLFAFYLTLGVLYAFQGVRYDNLGAWAITKEIVLYVLVYMLLVAGIRERKCLQLIHRTLVVATVLLCAYALNQLLFFFGALPDWLHVDLYANTTGTQAVAIDVLEIRGLFGMDLSSFPSFLFLQPYMTVHALIDRSRWRWGYSVLAFLSSVIMAVSGERLLLIIGLLSPMAIGLFLRLKSGGEVRGLRWLAAGYALGGVVLAGLTSRIGLDYQLAIEYVRQAFDPVGNVRFLQLYALMDGWTDRPVLGAGAGAVHWEYTRSAEEPWNYELSYVKYLFDFGLLGFLLYGVGILGVWWGSLRLYATRSELGAYALATAFGSMAFFLGNAANPYLLKFDYITVVFLPVAILNVWLVRGRNEHAEARTA